MTVAPRVRLCYVVSSEMTVGAFLMQHIAATTRKCDVSVVVNTQDLDCLARLGLAATLLPVPIQRRISPVRDLRALWLLYRLFRRHRFDLVHSVSPKAGLLSMLAAALAGVPVRIHMFTGQVWSTRRGWKRGLLKAADRLIARFATNVLADSPSQRDFMVEEGVVAAGKVGVLGAGSICGVDGSLRMAVQFAVLILCGWLIVDPATGVFGLAVYAFLRGFVDPLRRSDWRPWWGRRFWMVLASVPMAALIDVSSAAGRVTCMIKSGCRGSELPPKFRLPRDGV